MIQNSKRKVISFFGTRPEVIKLAPVIMELNRCQSIRHITCNTGQHWEMVQPLLKWFRIKPDLSLQLMKKDQSLSQFAARALTKTDKVLEKIKPDIVLCQGDTTTAMIVSLAAFHQKIKIAHVEAGLRSWNRFAPWPEEINRRIIDLICDYYFAPTLQAKKNLLEEGIPSSAIWVTGNSTIDALNWTLKKIQSHRLLLSSYPCALTCLLRRKDNSRLPLVIITAHRRESFDKDMLSIARAIKILATKYPHLLWVFPVHLNPHVQAVMLKQLRNVPNLLLTKPLDYSIFCYLLSRCYFVLTDSGGLQEECPSLGTPTLVMRTVTERPEGIQSGNVKLVGTTIHTIIQGVSEILENPAIYRKMSKKRYPFGDGKAAGRIVLALKHLL